MIQRRLQVTDHAIERMFERRLTPETVRHALEAGIVAEEYPEDRPFPSRLVVGWYESGCLHVVAADDVEEDVTIVVTVYEPDPAEWEPPDYVRRRRSQ